MGNVPGLDKDAQERIKSMTTDIMTTFSKEYMTAFIMNTKKQIKAETQGGAGLADPYQLLTCPPDSYILKEGFLLKRGGVKKNWKKRYFVLHNEDQNFIVRYYAKEADKTNPKKAKGEISLDGYRSAFVSDLRHAAAKSEAEMKSSKLEPSQVLKCYPWWGSDERRDWYLGVEVPSGMGKDSDDYKKLKSEWEGAFYKTVYKATAPVNPDPILGPTFIDAYTNTRSKLYIWGSWGLGGTEGDMLGDLVWQEVKRDVMQDVYRKLPSGSSRAMVERTVNQAVATIIGSIVKGMWQGAQTSVEAAKDTTVSGIKSAIGPILEAEASLIDQLTKGAESIMTPVLTKVVAPAVPKIFEVLLSPIKEACEETFKNWSEEAEKLVQNGAVKYIKDETSHSSSFERLRNGGCTKWNLFYDRYWKMRDFYVWNPSLECAAVSLLLETLGSDKTLADILEESVDGLENLCKNATFTWEHDIQGEQKPTHDDADDAEEEPELPPWPTDAKDKAAALLPTIKAKLAHDAQLYFADLFHKIIFGAVFTPFQKEVADPLVAVVKPLDDALPDAVKGFISVTEDLQIVLETAVNNAVQSVVRDKAMTGMEKLIST